MIGYLITAVIKQVVQTVLTQSQNPQHTIKDPVERIAIGRLMEPIRNQLPVNGSQKHRPETPLESLVVLVDLVDLVSAYDRYDTPHQPRFKMALLPNKPF